MAIRYKWVDKATFEAVYHKISKQIFNMGYFIDLSPFLTKREEKQRAAAAAARTELCLIAYDDMKPIGFSQSVINESGNLFMRLSGVLPRYRRKGIYATLLKRMIVQAKKDGYPQIISFHGVTNSAILIAKLKAGFTISGMQLAADVGSLVRLVYFTNPHIEALDRFRSGASRLDKKLAKKLKTSPLR